MTSAAPSVALEARDVRRVIDGRNVLDGASLTLRPGQLTALLGASGAGKSTLVRTLAGLEPLDGGEVRAGDQVLSAPGRTEPPEHRHIGVVFQDYALFPHLTAAQNIAFGARDASVEKKRAMAAALLNGAGLGDRAGAYPHELSGGEQQRIALLRALASDPVAVLMDEPFSNLDETLRRTTAERALALLKESRPAVLLVTHHAEEALFMADELALMRDGRIIQCGPPMEVFLEPVSLAAARLTGAANAWTGVVSGGRLETPFGALTASNDLEGVRADAIVRPEGVRLSPGADARVTLSRPTGVTAIVEFVSDRGDAVWRARVAAADAPGEGTQVAVTIDSAFARLRASED